MERHEIFDAMGELKLYGMRSSFDEIAGKGLARRDEVYLSLPKTPSARILRAGGRIV